MLYPYDLEGDTDNRFFKESFIDGNSAYNGLALQVVNLTLYKASISSGYLRADFLASAGQIGTKPPNGILVVRWNRGPFTESSWTCSTVL